MGEGRGTDEPGGQRIGPWRTNRRPWPCRARVAGASSPAREQRHAVPRISTMPPSPLAPKAFPSVFFISSVGRRRIRPQRLQIWPWIYGSGYQRATIGAGIAKREEMGEREGAEKVLPEGGRVIAPLLPPCFWAAAPSLMRPLQDPPCPWPGCAGPRRNAGRRVAAAAAAGGRAWAPGSRARGTRLGTEGPGRRVGGRA